MTVVQTVTAIHDRTERLPGLRFQDVRRSLDGMHQQRLAHLGVTSDGLRGEILRNDDERATMRDDIRTLIRIIETQDQQATIRRQAPSYVEVSVSGKDGFRTAVILLGTSLKAWWRRTSVTFRVGHDA